MPLKTLIVDDEPLNRDELKYLLSRQRDIVVAGEAANATQALLLIEQEAPDLILLDIQMKAPREGLNLAEALQKRPNPPAIIFVTAHPQHALEAYDFQPVHYLLKPVSEEKLAEALARAREKIASDNYSHLVDILRPIKHPGQRLAIRHRGKDHTGNTIYPTAFVQADEILFIHKTKNANTSEVHLKNGEVLEGVRLTLEEFKEMLDAKVFFGVHSSFLVNLAHVRGLKKRFSDEEKYLLVLRECPHEIPVAQNKLLALRERLERSFNVSRIY
ncbi:MAG: response regulator transcription factor [Gammaproteobacteria bacterium]|nr:response regulator transcription factor [Gammaproteobacteria bacterium]